MFEFDLQRFDEETSSPQPETPPEETPPTEESVPYARFKEKVDEANRLKAQLAEFQQRLQQPQTQTPQFQPPQIKITPEISAKINAEIKAEAPALSGTSDDDVANLEFADADDPRIAQWNQAQSIAQNRVYNAIQQTQLEQQQQARQLHDAHVAAVETYNQFVQKEFAEPDFKEIQNFARNEFFEQLSPNEKQILANSYLHVERQIASPSEMLVVKNFYERAKAAYRTRSAKKSAPKQTQAPPQLPRTDQLKGSSGTGDGQFSARDVEKLLEGDFTKLDEKTRKILKAWAKNTWDFGKKESYFSKFMGHSFDSIIQIQEDLSRGKGTSIEVSLIMPLNGAGVIEDRQMENNEEKMNYRSCTVYLSRVRNAVRLEGKFEEQKTQEKMRTDMRKVLSAWLARYFDLSIFAVLTGTQPPFETRPGQTLELPYTIEAPTADRILYAGSATSEASITASDVFDTTLIGKARRMAQEDELTAVKPIRVDGRETYVMVIDPYQARDLRRDPKWIEAQEYANIRGESNPIL